MTDLASKPEPRGPRGPRYQPLVIVLAVAAAGIAADRFWPLPLAAWWGLSLGGLIGWAAFRQSRREWLVNAALLLAIAALAASWHHCQWRLFDEDDLGRFARRAAAPVCVEAVALGSPRAGPPREPSPLQGMPQRDYSHLDVELTAIRDGVSWRPASGRARLSIEGPPTGIAEGDRLRIFGRLAAPRGLENPGGRDMATYLRADRVRGRITAEVRECVSVIEPGSAWRPLQWLAAAREQGRRSLERYLDPRQAELASAALLGLREELDGQRTEAFLATGTIHVLCISGLHVGIMAGALFWIGRRFRLPRGWMVAGIALIVLLYTLMVDVGPPVVRATILVLIACLASYLGRRAIGFNSLAAAALVVLAMNPAHLFHVGAQLSFLGVGGLIWCANRPHGNQSEGPDRTLRRLILQNLGWIKRQSLSWRHAIFGFFLASAVLWLISLPLVMARFHMLSPVALVLNALLWLPISVGMISGFGIVVFGTLFPPAAFLCGILCNASFWLLEGGVALGQQVPCGHVWLPGPSDWWLAGFYGGLALWAAFPRIRLRRARCVSLLAVWIAVGFVAAAWPHSRDRLDCTFLSVGHGCAAVLELPGGQTVLYDAGSIGSPTGGARAIAEFLWWRGKRRIDAVVLSHPDLDHFNALPELLEKISVGVVCVSPIMFDKHNSAVAAMREAITRHGVPVRELHAGDRLRFGDGCAGEILHPPRGGAIGSDNANSMVLLVDFRGRRVLLPGDLEPPGLDDMLAEEPTPCDVLLAPHHGSRKSNSPALAAWCRPAWVVLSGDGRWSVPDNESAYRAVGSRVLSTADRGAILARLTSSQVLVSDACD